MKIFIPLVVISVFLFSCATTTPSPISTPQPTALPVSQTSKSDYKDLGIPPAFKKLYDDAKLKKRIVDDKG